MLHFGNNIWLEQITQKLRGQRMPFLIATYRLIKLSTCVTKCSIWLKLYISDTTLGGITETRNHKWTQYYNYKCPTLPRGVSTKTKHLKNSTIRTTFYFNHAMLRIHRVFPQIKVALHSCRYPTNRICISNYKCF